MKERAGTSSWPSWISHFTGSFVGHSPSEMLCPPAHVRWKEWWWKTLCPGVDTHTHSLSVGLSRYVCIGLSVCLGLAGHTDEHTHDVNNAVSPGCRRGIANFYLRSHTDNHSHDINFRIFLNRKHQKYKTHSILEQNKSPTQAKAVCLAADLPVDAKPTQLRGFYDRSLCGAVQEGFMSPVLRAF